MNFIETMKVVYNDDMIILYLIVLLNTICVHICFNTYNVIQAILLGLILTIIIQYIIYNIIRIITYYVISYKLLFHDVDYMPINKRIKHYLIYLSLKSDIRLLLRLYNQTTSFNETITIAEFKESLKGTPLSIKD